MCSILNVTSYELRFGRKPSVSHLRAFGCKCFILKRGNLDKFESRSSDGIFLGYTLHGHSYRVLNLETNTIVESCDVTFDESNSCASNVVETAGNREMEESIFVEEDLQGLDDDDDESFHPTSELVPAASTTPAEGPEASTSTSAAVEPAPAVVEGEVRSEREAPHHIQRQHPPQQMIGNLYERTTRSRYAHLVCFTNSLRALDSTKWMSRVPS